MTSEQKITFAEMRDMGVRGIIVYCADYTCSHSIAVSGDAWPDDFRLSDIEPRPFERGEIGPDLFRAACEPGLEDLVSKHRDRPYQGGRSKHWVKVKNQKHPAITG